MRRCVVHADERRGDKFGVIVEGSDFAGVLSQIGVEPRRTHFNNAVVVAEVSTNTSSERMKFETRGRTISPKSGWITEKVRRETTS